MMELSLIILDFLHYLLCYKILYGVRLTRKLWKYIITLVIIILLYCVFNAGGIKAYALYLCQLFAGLLIPLILCEKKKIALSILYIPVLSLDILVGYVISFLFGIIKNRPGQIVMDEGELLVSLASLFLYIAIYLAVHKNIESKKDGEVLIDSRHIAFYSVVFICTAFSTAGASGLTINGIQKNVLATNLLGMGVTISCLILLFFCYWFEMLDHDIEREKAKSRSYKMYAQVQQRQIEEVIINNEKIRKERHDLKNHLIELKGLIDSKDLAAVEKYCEKIIGEDIPSHGISYTGDVAVDSIINYFSELAERKEIVFKYNIVAGIINAEQSYDICTVLSNLLSNAIEAQDELTEKQIDCVIYNYSGRLFIIVKNPCREQPVENNGVLVTTKEDRLNHGFGSINVKETVEKYDGSVNYEYLDGYFKAIAIFNCQ